MNWTVVKDPTVLVTSVVYGLLLAICSIAGIFGIWLGVLLFISIWRYSYLLLRAVAQGRKRIPPPDMDSFNPVGEWAVFWHFVFFPGVIIAAAPFQPLGSIIAVSAAVLFPASAALMGLTSSLSQAFNPAAIGHFVRTIGSDYWVLVGGTLAIFIGSSLVFALVLPVFGFMSGFLGFVVPVWALFASFALIGSVLRAHRLEFQIDGEVSPNEDRERTRRHEDWHRDLDIAYASFRSQGYAAGYKTLRDFVEREGDSIEVNYWLVENLLEWDDLRFALEVVVKLMPRLIAGGDTAGALQLYRRCRRKDPEFWLPAEQSAQLADHAEAIGQGGLAGELRYNPGDIQTKDTGSER